MLKGKSGKVLYYHLNSFPEISQRDEYRLATSFCLHSPRFRCGFDNQLDLLKNPLQITYHQNL